ncbi:hypothetical protein MLD38_016719 [Melastoma candidum]|uniref:Uncharacterized protein n=1 Tax=Melastoma candidum TaxID=119954 RepID=A0ACB9QND8_9MYRT|nr:hypothetical protein MLD38_016719 [Melastoma candidum]
MSPEIHGGGGSDGTPSGDSTVAAEVSKSSVRMNLSEIEKGVPTATGVIAVREGDDGEAGRQEGGGSLGEGDKPGEDESGSRYVVADAGVSKKDAQAVENDSFVIDIRPQWTPGGNLQGDKICRICHLSSEQVFDSNTPKVVAASKIGRSASFGAELILLGCGCKDDLGTAHRHCAEAWFKLKGNRFCEICGKSAKHVFGVGDNRFMEEWHDERGIASTSTSSSEGGSGCWRRQPFCNFLMACLVMAFVLPWFFRVNLF